MDAKPLLSCPLPDWATGLPTGRWCRISGDTPDCGIAPARRGTRYLIDNDPACDRRLNPPHGMQERTRRLLGRDWIAPWRGRIGFMAITEAWNGAVYAAGHGRAGAMVLFGGGHDDYFGSDVHCFDLETREWRRLTTGYVAGTAADYGAGAVYPDSCYPDGSPLPPHTYDYVQYDPAGNNLVLLKGQTELGAAPRATPIPHLFNLDTLRWRRGPRHATAILNSGGFSAWDSRRAMIWGHSGDDGGGNAFVAYDPVGENADGTVGTWRSCYPNKFAGSANHNTMAYHAARDEFVFALHATNTLAVLSAARPHDAVVPIHSPGPKPPIAEFAGFEYSTRSNRLIYCSAANRATVWSVELDAQARWTPLSAPTGLDPIADAAALSRRPVSRDHTFGRFRVGSYADGEIAILVRHVDTPVYAMRLTT